MNGVTDFHIGKKMHFLKWYKNSNMALCDPKMFEGIKEKFRENLIENNGYYYKITTRTKDKVNIEIYKVGSTGGKFFFPHIIWKEKVLLPNTAKEQTQYYIVDKFNSYTLSGYSLPSNCQLGVLDFFETAFNSLHNFKGVDVNKFKKSLLREVIINATGDNFVILHIADPEVKKQVENIFKHEIVHQGDYHTFESEQTIYVLKLAEEDLDDIW